jgi:heme oxygenase
MMNLRTYSVDSRETFLEFLTALKADFEQNGSKWENRSLQDFIRALSDWAVDMDGYYENVGLSTELRLDRELVKWRVFADMLAAARIYE